MVIYDEENYHYGFSGRKREPMALWAGGNHIACIYTYPKLCKTQPRFIQICSNFMKFIHNSLIVRWILLGNSSHIKVFSNHIHAGCKRWKHIFGTINWWCLNLQTGGGWLSGDSYLSSLYVIDLYQKQKMISHSDVVFISPMGSEKKSAHNLMG